MADGDGVSNGPEERPSLECCALTEVEVAVLAFEKQWWKYAGAKESAIRDEFGMSLTRYYQVLNSLIDRPEPLVVDPLTVGRLRRLRADRQAQRSGHRAAER